MSLPDLNINQFAVLMADGATGIVLNSDGKISTHKDDQVYLIFESIEEAHRFVQQIGQKNDTIEFCIYNYKKELYEFIKAIKFGGFTSEV